jgi:glycosyltransferase involved in cell wall biosynthesis
MASTIASIEAVGARFKDYAVIIYENNSKDETAALLKSWAQKNGQVTALCENLSEGQLAPTRTERIAAARNRVLELAREPRYADYPLVIMADLDFKKPWPVEEIVKTIESDQEWDCVTANGVDRNGTYYDRFAFRNVDHPLGPEVMGWIFWRRVQETFFKYSPGQSWQPAYSAFGGLGIYKREAILPYSYSGTATEDVKTYYTKITQPSRDPIAFQHDILADTLAREGIYTCCEHLPLHAAMFLNGHTKIFINPALVMEYDLIMQ